MKTAIVTGGAGFIGSHLCDALIEKGFEVICIDNLLTGSQRNIKHLIKNPNFTFIKADVSSFTNYQLLTTNYIFHLASPASPVDYQNYSEETLMVNSVGTINMLKLAKARKAGFLFASTSEVYGDPLEHPQKETYWGNVNSYGFWRCFYESKHFGESAIYLYI